MKRLTKKDFNICNVCARGPLGMDWDCDGSPACGEKVAFDRLAAIEDILGDEYDLDRLRELAEADREGRCVVLPRLETGQGDPPGDPGPLGPPGLCPNCDDWRGLVWDKTTGDSRCTICGWTNAKT